jgi:pimeloyl-ACP methyl ester carboxylesterase
MWVSATTPSPAADRQPSANRIPAHEAAPYGPEGRSPWLDIEWQEHQRWVIVDGEAINTIVLGDGPPLVFVHGLFGSSPMPDGEISISRYARLLDGLLDQLGIDAAGVIGNSMGGFIAAELAIACPQRVERLVLISAAGISTYADKRTARALPTLRRSERILAASAAWMASRSDTVARRPRLREATLALVVRHPGRLPAPLAAEQLRGAGKPGFLQAIESILDYDFRDRLREIACPTLIVWGDGDRLINVRDADVFAELIPGSRLVVFEDTGHMAMLERPRAFNALLKEFLAD